MALGRPTDYKPEYCQLLIEHMGNGYSFEAFAAVVNCNRDTLYEWVKVNEDFSDAKKIAMERSRLFWEDIGIKLCKGVLMGGSATAYIFNMKNRFKNEWRDKHETGFTDGDGNDINPVTIVQLPDNGRSKDNSTTAGVSD